MWLSGARLIRFRAQPFTCSVTMGILFKLISVSLRFFPLFNGDSNSVYLIKLLKGLTESVHLKQLKQCVAHVCSCY